VDLRRRRWKGEKKKKPDKFFTLVILLDGDETLLGWKKCGFGVGKWNGFGGKVGP